MSKIYRHYKNKDYKFHGLALHSESLEPLAVYTCLYDNPAGQLWVRPKDLFFGELEHAGKLQPRFREFQYPVSHFGGDLGGQREELLAVINEILPTFSNEKFLDKINNAKNIQAWLVRDNDKIIAFKLGYELTNETFYSWLGGVLPSYRGRGIAKTLMEAQHNWAAQQGYKTVATKTMNQWKQMLLLNIQSGFQITGTEQLPGEDFKILLEKKI